MSASTPDASTSGEQTIPGRARTRPGSAPGRARSFRGGVTSTAVHRTSRVSDSNSSSYARSDGSGEELNDFFPSSSGQFASVDALRRMSTQFGGTVRASGSGRQSLSTALVTQMVAKEAVSAPLPPSNYSEDAEVRLIEMCANHRLFQFMFDAEGHLLIANKRGMATLRKHLGEREVYSLRDYLELGQFASNGSSEDIYKEAVEAIFRRNVPCHRVTQRRQSSKSPEQDRWILFEMWPLLDPVSGWPCMVVTEQNITQVKALEQHFETQTRHLQAQLSEALLRQREEQEEELGLQMDTPADRTLKLLEKIASGETVEVADILGVMEVLKTAKDLHQPVDLDGRLRSKVDENEKTYDSEVADSLLQLLAGRNELSTITEDQEEPDAPSSGAVRLISPLHAVQIQSLSLFPHDGVPGEEVERALSIQRAPPTDIDRQLQLAELWQFDSFKLAAVTSGRPLSTIAFFYIKRSGLMDGLRLHEAKLAAFLMRLEDGYPENPYHNRTHAADVVHTMHMLLTQGGVAEHGCCDELGMLACYLSAAVHDFEHLGVNNDFLVRTHDQLATIYNDKSPLENHHLAAAFELLHGGEFNWLAALPPSHREALRKMVIELVLSTDMKQHFAIVSQFQSKVGAGGGGNSAGNSLDLASVASEESGMPHFELRAFDDDQRLLCLQVALKCADLGHLAGSLAVHQQWVAGLEEEFFRQGDREKGAGLPVSPLMDRDKQGITKSQVGFFDVVALPLFQNFHKVFHSSKPLLTGVLSNYNYWKSALAR